MVEKDKRKFTITYTGTIYGRLKMDKFLMAINRLISNGHIDPSLLNVRVVGHFNQSMIHQAFEWVGYKEVLEFKPYMPHQESIANLKAAHVLLFMVANGDGFKNIYTGKLFEYIHTGVPILAILPEDGCAADVIRQTKTGFIAEGTDDAAIEAVIAQLYTDWQADELSIEPDYDEISQYHRLAETKALIKMFKRFGV